MVQLVSEAARNGLQAGDLSGLHRATNRNAQALNHLVGYCAVNIEYHTRPQNMCRNDSTLRNDKG